MIPINWYLGTYAFNAETVEGFTQSPLGLVPWEQITVNK